MIPLTADSEMFWLNVTNIGLGVVVLICTAIVLVAIGQEVLARMRQREAIGNEIDRDMAALVAGDDHAFPVAGLGWTMADGGEPLPKPKTPKRKRS